MSALETNVLLNNLCNYWQQSFKTKTPFLVLTSLCIRLEMELHFKESTKLFHQQTKFETEVLLNREVYGVASCFQKKSSKNKACLMSIMELCRRSVQLGAKRVELFLLPEKLPIQLLNAIKEVVETGYFTMEDYLAKTLEEQYIEDDVKSNISQSKSTCTPVSKDEIRSQLKSINSKELNRGLPEYEKTRDCLIKMGDTNTAMVLNNLSQLIQEKFEYDCVPDGMHFQCTAKLPSYKIILKARGSNKKDAKRVACNLAIEELCKLYDVPVPESLRVANCSTLNPSAEPFSFTNSQVSSTVSDTDLISNVTADDQKENQEIKPDDDQKENQELKPVDDSNYIVQLNLWSQSYKFELKYVYEMKTDLTFNCTVEFLKDGFQLKSSGNGTSKKLAKFEASKNMVTSLKQFNFNF